MRSKSKTSGWKSQKEIEKAIKISGLNKKNTYRVLQQNPTSSFVALALKGKIKESNKIQNISFQMRPNEPKFVQYLEHRLKKKHIFFLLNFKAF